MSTDYVYLVHRHTLYEYDYPDDVIKTFRNKKDAEKFIEEYDKQFMKGYYIYYIEKSEIG